MSAEADEPQGSTTRKRLIEEAMVESVQFWAECDLQHDGTGVPYQYRLAFYKSLRRFLKQLEPLKERRVVEGWWDDVELSSNWTDEDGDPVTGMESIHDIVGMSEQVRRTEHTMRGEETVNYPRQYVPPFPVLEDFLNKLGIATDKLGFSPEVPDGPTEEAEFDYEDLLRPEDGDQVTADD